MEENKNKNISEKQTGEAIQYLLRKGYGSDGEYASRIGSDFQISATLWVTLEKINHEATRAREYLRLTGATCTPERIHEVLHLRTSRATLGRKMREAAQRGELLRCYYVNERGTKICHYYWNTEYKETI